MGLGLRLGLGLGVGFGLGEVSARVGVRARVGPRRTLALAVAPSFALQAEPARKLRPLGGGGGDVAAVTDVEVTRAADEHLGRIE